MGASSRQSWVRVTVLVGAVYAFVGITFAIPTDSVKLWRLAAWVVSAMAYTAHVCYERFRLRNSPGSAAVHVALAVALGALGLAAGAIVHSLRMGSTDEHRRLLLLALGLWPLITAVPAFVFAWAAGWVLTRFAAGSEAK